MNGIEIATMRGREPSNEVLRCGDKTKPGQHINSPEKKSF
jgi:hypothetical protein